MYRILFLALAAMLLCTAVQAQDLLRKKRDRVIKVMQSGYKDTKMAMASTDSTLLFDIGPGTDTHTKVVAHFDERGYCDSQTIIDDCKECFDKRLKKLLMDSNWEQLTEDHYVFAILLSIRTKELFVTSRSAPYSYVIKPVYAVKKRN